MKNGNFHMKKFAFIGLEYNMEGNSTLFNICLSIYMTIINIQ